MIILVEGIDRVGKTTLCNMLSAKLNIEVLKKERNYSIGDSNLLNYGVACGMIEMWKSNIMMDNFIVDRFHWTEQVYSKNLRGNGNFYMEDIERQLQEIPDVMLILVHPTDIKKSSQEHGLDLTPYEKDYIGLYERSKLRKFQCNYNTLHLAIEWVLRNGGTVNEK